MLGMECTRWAMEVLRAQKYSHRTGTMHQKVATWQMYSVQPLGTISLLRNGAGV